MTSSADLEKMDFSVKHTFEQCAVDMVLLGWNEDAEVWQNEIGDRIVISTDQSYLETKTSYDSALDNQD